MLHFCCPFPSFKISSLLLKYYAKVNRCFKYPNYSLVFFQLFSNIQIVIRTYYMVESFYRIIRSVCVLLQTCLWVLRFWYLIRFWMYGKPLRMIFVALWAKRCAYPSNMRNNRKISGSLYRKKYDLIIVAIFLSQCFIQSKFRD